MNGTEAPVKVGEEYDVMISAVGGKGDGIAKVKGFVLFVAGAKKGDYVKIRITKVLPSVGFAEVVKKVERPENRKYATVSARELEEPDEEPEHKYEETEDFGEEK
ncbi:TRAM domain-containing protein [Candidatus Woesearchaeota archaeon]|nr:TRAM domain-containing protein [Candidatus Woesearchaeota archaeon]MBI2582269.1 TRAM domain-containing protein [Candidatus Woesearchaeota archaeon]